MFRFHFVAVSKNSKTGAIPTVVSSRNTCPPSCALYDRGCYARNGHVRIHWDRTSESGIDSDTLAKNISSLPRNQVWRMNVAGDLPGEAENIDHGILSKFVRANRDKRGYTYTHKNPRLPKIAREVKWANRNGFTVNLSSNNVAEADEYAKLGIAPVVTLIPADFGEKIVIPGKKVNSHATLWKQTVTPEGRLVVQCPAEYTDKIQCSNCGGSRGPLCQRTDRNFIVGFTTHGITKNAAASVARKGLRVIQ